MNMFKKFIAYLRDLFSRPCPEINWEEFNECDPCPDECCATCPIQEAVKEVEEPVKVEPVKEEPVKEEPEAKEIIEAIEEVLDEPEKVQKAKKKRGRPKKKTEKKQ